MIKASRTSKKIKEQYEWKDEMVEKLIAFRQKQVILSNVNHPHYTDETKGNIAVVKIQEGFVDRGLIN